MFPTSKPGRSIGCGGNSKGGEDDGGDNDDGSHGSGNGGNIDNVVVMIMKGGMMNVVMLMVIAW